jgi:16S rRNA (guanine966-N2)-methyltransferase
MRVIAGEAKGRKLKMVPGEGTRPITDRAKEALFSIIGNWIEGVRVLDLFGGTGAVGIEALSRGADHVHFVDMSRKACQTILVNLQHCRMDTRARVQRADAFSVLTNYTGAPFDFVYIAPPQYKEMWHKALLQIDAHPELLAQYATVVVQIHPRESESVELSYLEEYDRREYGSVLLIFYAAAKDLIDDDDLEADEELNDEVGEGEER